MWFVLGRLWLDSPGWLYMSVALGEILSLMRPLPLWSLIFPVGESLLLRLLVLVLSSKGRNLLFKSLNTSCLLIFHRLSHPLTWILFEARFREEEIDFILDWKTCKIIYKGTWVRGGECFVTNLQHTT